ncbi:YlmH family RNA-binding protein [Streptococcus himalayensis]|uniref:S4 domain-containing protein YlmH n=1 Tax=Streptococcus himalayensis TaxID=1888195 RepID=A0A917A8J9_9STRE|nr:YlmH/Sll1252 family protein [Streptococcus himalayensis]GGE34221.1 S4 domain-containing protein YlmH [Streptococcus himalayensis]
MADKKDIIQHFSNEDSRFIDQCLEWVKRVEDTYTYVLTPFINPHQAEIVTIIGKTHGLHVHVSSDYLPSESVRVILAPSYYELLLSDFEITLLEIVYPSKFYQLKHGQILGTLLNRLGIERKVFGDILVSHQRAQVLVDEKFQQFFRDEIRKIAKVPVQLREVSWDKRLISEEKTATKELVVSSLRLDKLVAAAFHLSRAISADLILKKQVKVNYEVVDNPSKSIGQNDLMSVRGYGRFKVIGEQGLSKNGKHKIRIELLSSK